LFWLYLAAALPRRATMYISVIQFSALMTCALVDNSSKEKKKGIDLIHRMLQNGYCEGAGKWLCLLPQMIAMGLCNFVVLYQILMALD
jgi:hypothetical protein